MYQLLQLAAQHAGVDDIFHSLVPRWALGTLFDRIMDSKNADHHHLTTTWFQLLRDNNLLYHSMRRRVEGMSVPGQTPEEVILQRDEMRQRNKQAAAAVKRRMRHSDKTALYLSKDRPFLFDSMAAEFDGTFRPFNAYLPPMFRTTVQQETGLLSAKPDMHVTAAFPSAGAEMAGTTRSECETLTRSLGTSAHKLLPDTADVLATLKKYKTTQALCQKGERGRKATQVSGDTASALNSPVIATVKKPAAYRLTNGMIGKGKPKLCWSAGEDEDSVVLPALPLTVIEECDPVKKHIDQVNTTVRRSTQAATLASLTDFHAERQQEGREHPSMLDLPDEVWRAMVANSKRILWPGQCGCNKEVILNERGEEEEVKAGPAGRSATKAAILNAAIRLQRTIRLRQLFERMDKQKTGVLTLDQFKEYMARENPRSVKRAAEIFAAMGNKPQEHSQDEVCRVPTVSFIEMLRVFFPETTEIERRQLAVAVPPSISPCIGLYDSMELEKLLEQVYARYLQPRTDAYTKKMWESVRQLIGALGLGDHVDEESRNQMFEQIDMDGNGKIDQKDILLWYLDMMDEHESATEFEGVA